RAVPMNWSESLFTLDHENRQYVGFVASLHAAVITKRKVEIDDGRGKRAEPRWETATLPNQPRRYGVISLNYDTLIERLTDHLNRDEAPALKVTSDGGALDADDYQALPLAKLHGSVGGRIVPPTWSKGFHPEIMPVWHLAYRLLARASHIRILGYS